MQNRSITMTLAISIMLAACAVGAEVTTDWNSTAARLRGNNQRVYVFFCPAGGTLSSRVWGTDIYTDDSSVCTAAVHAGRTTTSSGGPVEFEIRPGQSSYAASNRNGVASKSYGSWAGSFVFFTPPLSSGDHDAWGARKADWTTQADSLRGRDGETFSFTCAAGGTISSRLWGTDLYTDDSSICTAAVHAGLISAAAGGTVTIEIRPGQSSYAASTRNGVPGKSFGEWKGSFAFTDHAPPIEPPRVGPGESQGQSISWKHQADKYRGRNGEKFDFACPAGGTISSRLWGADLYTDDSSICTAAVHAGLISAAAGGTVTIEIRPGQSSYAASKRNGVPSKSFGSWSGSFAFVTR